MRRRVHEHVRADPRAMGAHGGLDEGREDGHMNLFGADHNSDAVRIYGNHGERCEGMRTTSGSFRYFVHKERFLLKSRMGLVGHRLTLER